MEARLATHISDQDRIDESAFCLGCGKIVYLHDRSTYQCVGDDILCCQCSVDCAAIDAAQMGFEDWKKHWCAFYGVPVPR